MIIRLDRAERQNFVILDTRAARDSNLSLRALGLHTYLMTMADHWEIRIGQLVKDRKEGREAIRNALNELEAAGYLRKEPRKEAGRFAGYDLKLFEIPCATGAGFPSPVFPSPVNRPLSKNNEKKDHLEEKSTIVPKGPPTEKVRAKIRDRTADEIALANLVQLGLFASQPLKDAWSAWLGYRTDRATRPLSGEKRAAWTERAAEAEKRNVEALSAKWGDAQTIDCINKAIDRRWLGIYGPKTTSEATANTAAMTEAQLKIF